MSGPAPSPWSNAVLAATLFAVDPAGTGVWVKALPGPVRDRWLSLLRAMLPSCAPVRRCPLHVTDERLLGGLDLAATLRAGRKVAARGLLAEADGGVVLLGMAERLAPATAARLGAVLDRGEVALERDGLALCLPARVGMVALDEGMAEDERPPAALLDRMAFRVDLDLVRVGDAAGPASPGDEAVRAARALLPEVRADEAVLHALCAATLELGIASGRAALLAVRVARAAAALAGRRDVSEADAVLAGRLVLGPRATCLPAAEQQPGEGGENAPPPQGGGQDESDGKGDAPLGDAVLAAAQAAIPAGMLQQLQAASSGAARARIGAAGAGGERRAAAQRGRPIGVRRGEPGTGARLSLIETLRAAAPWQALRRRELESGRIEVRRDDFRVIRFEERRRTTAIFAVDASGSSALHRLAEAKGAVELLLAECYVRRDRVALLAFRGRGADLLLPPTGSLVRARRSLGILPGGGGTPLAAGLDTAASLADGVRRKGETPVVILLTDGRANVARNGEAGRAQAEADALDSARRVRAAGITALLVDISPRPQPLAGRLAAEMGATYLPLPQADAAALSRAVRTSVQPVRGTAAAR